MESLEFEFRKTAIHTSPFPFFPPRLALLSLEPTLARMLLIGYSLGCLDAVLCCACAKSYRQPFLLPMQPEARVCLCLLFAR